MSTFPKKNQGYTMKKEINLKNTSIGNPFETMTDDGMLNEDLRNMSKTISTKYNNSQSAMSRSNRANSQ